MTIARSFSYNFFVKFHGKKNGSHNQGSYASGKCQGNLNFFKVGIVREFYVVSVKNGYLLKCQGNVTEFYNFQFV